MLNEMNIPTGQESHHPLKIMVNDYTF